MKKLEKTLIAVILILSPPTDAIASAASAPTGSQQGVAIHDPFKGRIRVIVPEKDIEIRKNDDGTGHLKIERSTCIGLCFGFGGNSKKGKTTKLSSIDSAHVRFFGNPDDFAAMTVNYVCDGRSLLQYSWAYYSAQNIELQFNSQWGTSEAVISSLILRTPWLAQYFDVYQSNTRRQTPSVFMANSSHTGNHSSLKYSETHSGLSRREILYAMEHTSWVHQLCDSNSRVRQVLSPYYANTAGIDPDVPMFTRKPFYKKSHKTLYVDFLYDADSWVDDVEADALDELKATRALIEDYLAGLKK